MICELKFQSSLSKELNGRAQQAHQAKLETYPEYTSLAQEDLKTRPEHVSIKRFAVFQVLHKEFSGSGVLGLAWALGTSKKIARNFQYWIVKNPMTKKPITKKTAKKPAAKK